MSRRTGGDTVPPLSTQDIQDARDALFTRYIEVFGMPPHEAWAQACELVADSEVEWVYRCEASFAARGSC